VLASVFMVYTIASLLAVLGNFLIIFDAFVEERKLDFHAISGYIVCNTVIATVNETKLYELLTRSLDNLPTLPPRLSVAITCR
jgi:hypothetical protein